MSQPAIHLLALPHTATAPGFETCAYTQKIIKFCRMMGTRGHQLILYGPERNTAPCAQHVPLLTEQERVDLYGPDDPNRLPDWPTEWDLYNRRAITALLEHSRPRDLVLVTGGHPQKLLAHALPDRMVVEPFVGYEGIFAERCAYESYAWMHHLYGLRGWRHGRWFDTVIPNFFDPDELPARTRPGGDYLLYMGRLIGSKGVHTAAQIAKHTGMPLLVAGPGCLSHSEGLIVYQDGILDGDVHYMGVANVQERADLMRGAAALLAPTEYLEPFGGVAVEAMICGTPAITSDWGAFTETVEPGLTGYRFRTLAEAVAAVAAAKNLSPTKIRRRALERYSLQAVAPMFDRWFDQLEQLWRTGWNELDTHREEAAA